MELIISQDMNEKYQLHLDTPEETSDVFIGDDLDTMQEAITEILAEYPDVWVKTDKSIKPNDESFMHIFKVTDKETGEFRRFARSSESARNPFRNRKTYLSANRGCSVSFDSLAL